MFYAWNVWNAGMSSDAEDWELFESLNMVDAKAPVDFSQ